MKATGIVRQLDQLGRVVIPMELRRTLGINTQDPLEIFVDGENIILHKYEPSCTFCGEANNTVTFNGKLVCKNCIQEMTSMTHVNA